jgi:alpha-beta hydrolase superfamily lysophospholipase
MAAVCKTCIFLGYPVPLILREFYYFTVARVEIAKKYTPKVYPGRVVVFAAKEDCGAHGDWSRLAADKVHVHEVPGAKHLTIMEDPFVVGTWAKQLNSYLNETRTGKEH